MSITKKIKNHVKKGLLIGGLAATLGACDDSPNPASKQYYVDLNNDSKKEIVYARYDGRGWGDEIWGLYQAGETPKKLFTLKGTNKFKFEDMNGDGFPEIVFQLYAGKGWGDDIWDVYSVENFKGEFGKVQKIARLNEYTKLN